MRQLPVLAAFTHAVNSTRNNLGFAFRASWPWLVVLIPLKLWVDYMMEGFVPPQPGTEMSPEDFWRLALTLVVQWTIIICYASIAVGWHRYILLDEVPKGAQRMRLDGVVWRYVGNTLLAGLMLAVVFIPAIVLASFFMSAMGAGKSALVPVTTTLVFLFLPIIYRLSIKLPAVALGRRDFTFGHGWEATKDNNIQLFLLGLLGAICGWAVQLGLPFILQVPATQLGTSGWLISNLIIEAASWVLAIFAITQLTSLYGFFVEKRDF